MKTYTIPLSEREFHINKSGDEAFFRVWCSDPFWIRRLKKSPFLYDLKIIHDSNGKNPCFKAKMNLKGFTLRQKDRYKKSNTKLEL